MNRLVSGLVYAVAVAAIVLVGIVAYRLASPPQPPFAYTQEEYTPERAVYAPGETLVYTAALTIKRAGQVDVIRGFRTKPDARWAQLCDGTNAKPIDLTGPNAPPPFPPDAVNTNVEGRVVVTIPNLKPGVYWLISSAQKKDGGESVTKASFRIEQPCGGR